MKRSFIYSVLFLISASTYYYFHYQHLKKAELKAAKAFQGEPEEDDAAQRGAWEFKRLAGPDGTIPQNMRQKELAYSATLPNNNSGHSNLARSSAQWQSRGPWNVGGRTRAFGIDVQNENHLIAGNTSGGIWSSSDGGESWTPVTAPDTYLGITCLVQDQRPGHEQTWYAGTGEAYGASASGSGAYYLGNGILKSTDNGQSWSPLTSTQSNTPQTFDSRFDLNWDLAIDQHDTSQEVVYAACVGNIYKSTDGGQTWVIVKGGGINGYSYYTDVATTRDSGIVYTTLSSDGPYAGIWRSTNQGVSWTKISNNNFGDQNCNRIVMGINPSNENEIYFLANTSQGLGIPDTNYLGDVEYNALWRYTYLSGDGSGSGGHWDNLSQNLPKNDQYGVFGNYSSQNSYDMVVRVKPDDPNTVFIGGTNVFRSTSRFDDSTHTTYMGGYLPYTHLPHVLDYPEHHPDQHGIYFMPSNPDVMISTNDGGIWKTTNCTADSVTWTSLNNGYLSTMFYGVAMDHGSTSDVLTGGAQDNGSWWSGSSDATANWTYTTGGDGAYCAIENGGNTYYFSAQNGKMWKESLDVNGNIVNGRRIDPIGGKKYQFINPFALDPVDQHIMYLAGGKYLWRNNDLSAIPMDNGTDSISTNWVQWPDSISPAGVTITAITACSTPAHRIYFGTSQQRIYRVDNANTGTPTPVNITSGILPSGGYVNCIAVNPNNGDEVMLVYSNYSTYSIFHSFDAGATWQKAAGNLEEQSISGGGDGPSIRWATIIPVNNATVYMVATSTGVYATDSLAGYNTVWVRQANNLIGTQVCDMIDYRSTDGLVAVATHATGIYTTYITSLSDVTLGNKELTSLTNTRIYPNPAQGTAQLSYSLRLPAKVKISVIDESGKTVFTPFSGQAGSGSHLTKLNLDGLSPGIYLVEITAGKDHQVKKLIVSR